MNDRLIIDSPEADEYAEYYRGYIDLVPKGDLLGYFASQSESTASLLNTLPEAKLLYRYAEGKWSIKDVIQHIIDSERVFSYRALAIARGDAAELPGFSEDNYAASAHADRRSAESLADEYRAVRAGTIALFHSLDEKAFMQKGTANKRTISVRAIGYIIAGHELHHLGVVKERYIAK